MAFHNSISESLSHKLLSFPGSQGFHEREADVFLLNQQNSSPWEKPAPDQSFMEQGPSEFKHKVFIAVT